MRNKFTSIMPVLILVLVLILASTAVGAVGDPAPLSGNTTDTTGLIVFWEYYPEFLFGTITIDNRNGSFDVLQQFFPLTSKVNYMDRDGSAMVYSYDSDRNAIFTDEDVGVGQIAAFNFTVTDTNGIDSWYANYAWTNDEQDFTGPMIGGLFDKSQGIPNAPVVPEPISSILFLTGAGTLAVRRFFKRKPA